MLCLECHTYREKRDALPPPPQFRYVLVHTACKHTSVSEQSGDEIMAVMNANVSYACGRARRCCRRSVNCPESYPFHISQACKSVDERLVSDKCVSTVLTPDTAATVPSPLYARHIAHRRHLPIRICDTQACELDFLCIHYRSEDLESQRYF